MQKYILCDYETEAPLFEMQNFIECFDIFANNFEFTFSCDYPDQSCLSRLKNGQKYLIKVYGYQKEIFIDIYTFSFEKFFNNLIININLIEAEEYQPVPTKPYQFGVLSLIDAFSTNEDHRPWFGLIGDKKQLYIAASLCITGVQTTPIKNQIILEGKYITDYFAFYCELGYALWGKFGYMGGCLNSFEECLQALKKNKKIELIWKDFALCQHSMANYADHQTPYDGVELADIAANYLSDYFDVTLD
ncbi:hypothetical protein [Bartonella sp. HY406]|uniref:hypothetical protein n=1 Tax=Bartonella sp. HY406 TaxID=2979331 RepID=UPI0021CA9E2F|nr:hypothetical protein [Bartonella sp. HY406]UXN03029.1 hypothetical protein N6B01_11230 [Bartonella sp. HY406]